MKTLLLPACALVAATAAFAGAGAHPAADMFAKMDANGDGRVSAEEHAAAAHAMFIQADTNGDNVVTAAELAAVRDSRADSSAQETASTRGAPQADSAAAAAKIRVIDQDGDGKLTAAEHEAGAKHMFAQMDTNHDGYLSPEECEAGHARLMPKN